MVLLSFALADRFNVARRFKQMAQARIAAEHQLRRNSGEVFWVEISGNCLRPNDPDSGVIWTYLDISVPRNPEAAPDLPPAAVSP
jgi:hypothetical protein